VCFDCTCHNPTIGPVLYYSHPPLTFSKSATFPIPGPGNGSRHRFNAVFAFGSVRIWRNDREQRSEDTCHLPPSRGEHHTHKIDGKRSHDAWC
jgi:hypothetical protein